MIISINYLFWLLGIILLIVAGMTFLDKKHPKRLSSGTFWLIYAIIFLGGDILPPELIGVLVITMAILAGFKKVIAGNHTQMDIVKRKLSALKLGNKLFLPVLMIPLTAVICTIVLKSVKLGNLYLFDPQNITIIGVGLGSIIGLILACIITKDTPLQGLRESRRLIDSLSWAIVLPQMLAMLGLVFAQTGVGLATASVITQYINMDYKFVAVSVYVLGMALLTIVMGNAFVAFPVMAGGVGIPILIGIYHVNPAAMAAIGMLSGYCGTLMTPMAANFNIVPAALLELTDKNQIIKVQIPTGISILIANLFILYFVM